MWNVIAAGIGGLLFIKTFERGFSLLELYYQNLIK
jgi:hypothetical protein